MEIAVWWWWTAWLIPIGILAATATASVPLGRGSAAAESVEVVGTEFRIHRTDGTVLAGAALVGAILTVADPRGLSTSIRIDSVELAENDPGVRLYGLSIKDATGAWSDGLCTPDFEGKRKAFPMRGALAEDGQYHPEAPGFSITCTSGAQAKCVRWGYKPWEPDVGEVSMLALYRSCMRMVRADYCGNGTPSTRNGTPIDVYDVAGIQKPETSSSMRFEAAWSPKGAVCVRHTRIPDVLSMQQLVSQCPWLADAVREQCDDSAPGALLFNKSN